jgi:hypothetical protein
LLCDAILPLGMAHERTPYEDYFIYILLILFFAMCIEGNLMPDIYPCNCVQLCENLFFFGKSSYYELERTKHVNDVVSMLCYVAVETASAAANEEEIFAFHLLLRSSFLKNIKMEN